MATGSRRAMRGAACVPIGLAGALLAGMLLSGQGRPTSPRGAIDPVGSGFTTVPDPRASASEAPPTTRIVLGPGGRDLRLSGELTEGAAERLARLLAAHRAVVRIHLTSEGGLVDEGAAIGALIAAHGLVTYVPDYCVSACTLAFVRGRERWVLAEARLGFHAPYETGPSGVEIAVDSAPERAAYLAAGVSADFVDAALGIPPDDLMIPDAETLVRAGIATGIVDPYRFPDSTLDERAGPEDARSAVLRAVPLLDAVEAGAPGSVAALAAWYLDGYRHGRSEGEAFDGIRRRAARAVARSLEGAEPDILMDLGRLTRDGLRRRSPDRSRACAAARSGVGAVLTRFRRGTADLAAARQILSRAFGPGSGPSSDEASPLPERSPGADPAAAARSVLHRRGCSALRKALAAALARPASEAGRMLVPLLLPERGPTRPRPTQEASAQP